MELLGSEHELDEKRQKRAEARAKRREEIDKAMSENPLPDGSGSDIKLRREVREARAIGAGFALCGSTFRAAPVNMWPRTGCHHP
jgi:hypothetical protein